MEGSLFNSGFLGSKFLWWIGQVADDRTWRDNQNPKKVEDPKEDMPAWGYRYKVRIMGLHDQDESTIESDNLPWAQVMYSVWGGGLAGSRQTPGIRQGMFVFGFFMDGPDMQVPIIMGVLGANAKTVVEKLKTGKDEDGENFVPQSGWSNSHDDECKKVPDEQIATTEPSSVGTIESSDSCLQETVEDRRTEDCMTRKHAISCPDPLHQSDTRNIQTCVEECSKKIEQLQRQMEDYASAVSAGLPTNPLTNSVENIIEDTAGEISGPMKGIMSQVQQLTIDEYNLEMQPILNLAVPSFKNKLLEENIAALEEISCLFNGINAGLAGLVGGALMNSFKRKKKQAQTSAVKSANASQGKRTSGDEDYEPVLDDPIEVPSPPPKGYYQPSRICSTEELMGEVLGSTINQITQGFASALSGPASTASNSLTQGGSNVGQTIEGNAPTRSVDMSASQSNVVASLKDGALFGGIAGALAAAAGVDVSLIGSVTTAFKSGNYASGLASMLSLSGVSSDSGVVTAAIHAINSGDIMGGFTEAASALGVPTGLMSNIGGAFSAIKGGDMSALTGAIQGLSGFDPGVLSSVAGMAEGLPIDGMGMMGGMQVDIASAMNFVQSVTQLFECDPEQECSPNDEITLDEGGGATEEPNCAAIAEASDNAATTGTS